MVLSHVIHRFENNLLPQGDTRCFFNFQIPPILPQSLQTRETLGSIRAKIKYYFKVQVVPVEIKMLNNEDGKSKIRARERILISPIRPVVTDP